MLMFDNQGLLFHGILIGSSVFMQYWIKCSFGMTLLTEVSIVDNKFCLDLRIILD